MRSLLLTGAMVGIAACAYSLARFGQPWEVLVLAAAVGLAVATAFALARQRPGPSDAPDSPRPYRETRDGTLEQVLTALPVGIVIVGHDGRITSFNDAAGQIFGVSPQRAKGRTLIESVRSMEMDRRLSATLRSAVGETIEFSYAGAARRRLRLTTQALADDGGGRQALAIIADLTSIRELESLRRDFVSNVSHELRTPLTSIKLMVETLAAGVEPPARDEFLQSIGRETDRMIALVRDLLDLARLESGKAVLQKSAVDIGELCREAAATSRNRAQAMSIDLECSTPETRLVIPADQEKLRQVIVNLLDNALRHTPAGGWWRVEANATSI
ncbi:MAG: sensor histidine kinase, partial [Candidatus Eremiobacter antarcticus]